MTTEQNIRAILECNFAGFKEEIIDDVTKRLCEMINDLGFLKWNDIKKKEPPYNTDIVVIDINGDVYRTYRTAFSTYYDDMSNKVIDIKWWSLLPRQNESEEKNGH